MDKPLTVLLVEDDQEECKSFVRLIDTMEDVRLIGVTNNETKALEYVKDHLPDAVILDLELHKGKGNGIAFLEALKMMHMKLPPYILVTTHNISRMTHDRVRQEGTDFIMVKSQEDYSTKNVIEFLRSLKKTIHESRKKILQRNGSDEESPHDIKKRLEMRVTAEIDQIGISPKALGRNYLIDAIMHRADGQHGQVSAIAKKYSKTEASVERAMQNAINKAWSTMHPDDLLLHYTARIHSDKAVPTVTEFICFYANKLKTEY
ncbi:MAG: response regulator [Oscillospiraceae bacterium]|nr:response regulator [Oscillospiraceae bacterium]